MPPFEKNNSIQVEKYDFALKPTDNQPSGHTSTDYWSNIENTILTVINTLTEQKITEQKIIEDKNYDNKKIYI